VLSPLAIRNVHSLCYDSGEIAKSTTLVIEPQPANGNNVLWLYFNRNNNSVVILLDVPLCVLLGQETVKALVNKLAGFSRSRIGLEVSETHFPVLAARKIPGDKMQRLI